MVPPKGAEAKPKMFFLFSDMLLQVKRCSSLHSTSGQKFTAEHAYPLQDCTVEKVFGHTRSQGGLLSVSVCQLLVPEKPAERAQPQRLYERYLLAVRAVRIMENDTTFLMLPVYIITIKMRLKFRLAALIQGFNKNYNLTCSGVTDIL